MSKSRIFLLALLAFIGGVAIRSFVAVPYLLLWFLFMGGVTIMAFGLVKRKHILMISAVVIFMWCGGVVRFDHATYRIPDISLFAGSAVVLRGVIYEEPEQTLAVQRFKFRVEAMDGKETIPSFFTLVTVRKYPAYRLGDALNIEGVLEGPVNYGDFDYVSFLAKEDIASMISFPLVEKIGEGGAGILRQFLGRVKHAFEEKIDAVFPEPHAAFLKGLTLGERESLPPELVEDFRRTGTSHIVALSGYNITMIGNFIMGVLLLLTVPFGIAFWTASLLIVLFVMLTGASASVVRAGIMGILLLVAKKEGRAYHMINALAAAAVGMIFYNPRILRFDAGFQLSFLATVGLVYAAPLVEEKIDRGAGYLRDFFHLPHLWREKRMRAREGERQLFSLKHILIETLAAQLMVLPLLIYLFGTVSLISPFTNVLVLVAVPYAMWLGFLTGFLGFLWHPLSQVFGWITWVLLEYQIRVIGFFSQFSFASIEAGAWTLIIVMGLYGWILWRVVRRHIAKLGGK